MLRILSIVLMLSTRGACGGDFSKWNAQAGEGVRIQRNGEFIEVSYESAQKKAVIIRPSRPVPLTEDTSRIRLWFASLQGEFDLILLVTDGKQVEHEVKLETSRYFSSWIHPKSVLEKFSCWYQADSGLLAPTAKIEDRVQREYLKTVRSMLWPQPLQLSGLKIVPATSTRNALANAQDVAAGKVRVCLANWDAISFDGLSADTNWFLEERGRWGWNTNPVIFPDDLTMTSGERRYQLELRKGFQGEVIWKKEGTLTVQQDNAANLFRNAVKLPVPPRGRYFLDAKVWLPDGTLEGTRWMHMYVYQSPETETVSVQSSMEWVSGREWNVFEANEAAELTLACSASEVFSLPKSARCDVSIRNWQETEVFKTNCVPGERISFQGTPGQAYVITGKLFFGTRLINQTQLMFGFKNQETVSGSYTVPESVPYREELLRGEVQFAAEHWGEYLQHYGPICPPSGYGLPMTPARAAKLDEWLNSLPEHGVEIAGFYFTSGMVEPLPGVFFWEELDRRIELAGSLGLKVILNPSAPNSNPYREPIWSDSMPMLDQYGYTFLDTAGKYTWPGSWSMGESYFPFLKAMAAHFAENPVVVAYKLEKLAARDRESSETKAELRIADYSLDAQNAYTAWRTNNGLAPEALAKRFSLPGVDAPDTGPDLSPEWQSTMAFRAFSGYEWVKQSMETIREIDPRRMLIVYQMATMENVIPLLKQYGGTLLPEGGPNYNELYESSLMTQMGLPYAHEPSTFVPKERAHIDSSYFYSSCFGNEAFWNFRWHQDAYGQQTDLLPALEFLKKSMPAYQEWYATGRMEPEILVLGSRAEKLLSRPRRIELPGLAGFTEFVALYLFHQIPAHYANEFTDWVDLQKFKLVILAGDVVPENVAERITAYAQNGGKVLLSGSAGQYEPGNPSSRNVLSERLIALPNVRRISAPAVTVPNAYWSTHGHVKTMFNQTELEPVLEWAGIQRNITTSAPGFAVLLRTGDDGCLYAAVFRRLQYGRLPGATLQETFDGDTVGCTVTVHQLSADRYTVELFHREKRSMGKIKPDSNQSITIAVDTMEQGEFRLFKLTPEK
ncbi:MAG: alpha-amylase family protein [Kiritimatiellales bacterium]